MYTCHKPKCSASVRRNFSKGFRFQLYCENTHPVWVSPDRDFSGTHAPVFCGKPPPWRLAAARDDGVNGGGTIIITRRHATPSHQHLQCGDNHPSLMSIAASMSSKRSFRAAIRHWMGSIHMPMTATRELFLCKYAALLNLRGIARTDPRCIQAAMEVLLTSSRDPDKHRQYLQSVNAKLMVAIMEAAQLVAIPQGHGTEWQCPGLPEDDDRVILN